MLYDTISRIITPLTRKRLFFLVFFWQLLSLQNYITDNFLAPLKLSVCLFVNFSTSSCSSKPWCQFHTIMAQNILHLKGFHLSKKLPNEYNSQVAKKR